jgi:hypothetical protein
VDSRPVCNLRPADDESDLARRLPPGQPATHYPIAIGIDPGHGIQGTHDGFKKAKTLARRFGG